MKRILITVIAAVLMLGILAGCRSNKNDLEQRLKNNPYYDLLLSASSLDNSGFPAAVSKTDVINYSYLLETKTKQTGGDLTSLKRLAFINAENALTELWVVDFENGYCYFDNSIMMLYDVDTAEKRTELTDELREFITKALVDNKVSGWEKSYDGRNGNDTGSMSWTLALELADGSIERHSGSGTIDGTPQTYYTFRRCMFELKNKYMS